MHGICAGHGDSQLFWLPRIELAAISYLTLQHLRRQLHLWAFVALLMSISLLLFPDTKLFFSSALVLISDTLLTKRHCWWLCNRSHILDFFLQYISQKVSLFIHLMLKLKLVCTTYHKRSIACCSLSIGLIRPLVLKEFPAVKISFCRPLIRKRE